MNNRAFLKNIGKRLIDLFGFTDVEYYYAHKIEPILLQIKQEKIISNKIPESFEGFTIVQFSDTHIGFQYTTDQLDKLVQKINRVKPNAIVFTGDLIDEPQT